jgi:hypothetical protein
LNLYIHNIRRDLRKIMSLVVIKKTLDVDNLPKVIEKSFPDYNNNDLLLGYLENQNKLRRDILVTTVPPLPTSSFTYNEIPIQTNDALPYEVNRDLENRDEMMWKLKKIRKQHKDIDIPVFDELTPTQTLAIYLRNALREINFTEKVDNLKSLLFLFSMVTEYIGTQYAGLNLTGFTTSQMHNMDDYEKSLMEMSERSYMGWSDRTSPELKLFFIFLKNAATYLIAGKGEIPEHKYKMRGPL